MSGPHSLLWGGNTTLQVLLVSRHSSPFQGVRTGLSCVACSCARSTYVSCGRSIRTTTHTRASNGWTSSNQRTHLHTHTQTAAFILPPPPLLGAPQSTIASYHFDFPRETERQSDVTVYYVFAFEEYSSSNTRMEKAACCT
jgi:hypothetical protein